MPSKPECGVKQLDPKDFDPETYRCRGPLFIAVRHHEYIIRCEKHRPVVERHNPDLKFVSVGRRATNGHS